MPKNSPATRRSAQRNKPRTQKAFELVRTPSEQQQAFEPEERAEPATYSVSTATEEAPASPRTDTKAIRDTTSKKIVVSEVPPQIAPSVASMESAADTAGTTQTTSTTPKGSAAAKLAARRQATQKAQQRSAVSLITAEHYGYVRKDLIFIAILAVIFFSAIVILYFVPGIGH